MKNLVIFGAPGSGKGTQSDLLVQKYGFDHISTGDVLRAEIKAGTELGNTAKQYIDNGQLIPDALMIDILAATYDALPKTQGVIFDGFPRTIPQADALKAMLAERGTGVHAMLELSVPDDNEETIAKRLSVYHAQTAPLVEWYAQEGIHNPVQGYGSLEDINANLCVVIDAL